MVHGTAGTAEHGRRAARRGSGAARLAGITAAVLGAVALPSAIVSAPAAAAAPAPRAVGTALVWQQALPDDGSPIGQSSPSVATLDGGGPSVVVGDRTGTLWAFHLSNGTSPVGWPAHTGGAPIDSTASSAPVVGGGLDTVYVGCGQRRQRPGGRLLRLQPAGQQIWGARTPPTPTATTACRPRWPVGSMDGVTGVTAPSLGQNQYAMNAASGGVLPGWPFFTADSRFSTPSLADLSGTQRDGGGRRLLAGPGLRPDLHRRRATSGCWDGGGNLLCDQDFNQTIDSSPAVGNFLGRRGHRHRHGHRLLLSGRLRLQHCLSA